MYMPEALVRTTSREFKEAAMSHINEIYGVAVSLSQAGPRAEDLTAAAYHGVCRNYDVPTKDSDEIRFRLYCELIKASL